MENNEELQEKYLLLLQENEKLKSRNEELFKVVLGFNGQTLKVEDKKEAEKFDLKDLKF